MLNGDGDPYEVYLYKQLSIRTSCLIFIVNTSLLVVRNTSRVETAGVV